LHPAIREQGRRLAGEQLETIFPRAGAVDLGLL
jgi:hypothetical protein